MRGITFVCALVVAAAGCGGGDDGSGTVDAGGADAGSIDASADPDAAAASCDPVAQDCPTVEAPKCSVTFDPSGPQCLPSSGSEGLDQPCVRPTGVGGIDSCEGGLYCANFGVDVGRVCRTVCTAAAPCQDTTRVCLEMLQSGFGVCLPGCTPLSTGECAQGTQCIASNEPGGSTIGFCETVGAGVQGGACSSHQDCAAGLTCVNKLGGSTSCEVACETSGNTPCAQGVTCSPLTNAPGYGYCEPGA